MLRKALIVEDDLDLAQLLSEYLRRWGFEPTYHLKGESVVSWTRAHQPSLILLDLMLPDIDGYELCQELKLDRTTNLIPIVMVTARDQHEDRVHGLAVGANYYLTKPFSESDLRYAIAIAFAWRDDLKRRGTQGEIHFQLQSDTQYLDELNHLLGSLFLFSRLSPVQVRQLMTAVRELGANAIEWGHRNQVDRLVKVTYHIDAEKISIVIRDSGPGFDPASLPHAAQPEDPVSHMDVRQAGGLREGGFGIMMARGLVDHLEYNATGNEVRLVKFFSPLPGTAESSTAKPVP